MGERAFFQIAVALIPVLLFGGVLVNRSDFDSDEPPSWFEALITAALPTLGLFAILAEVVSILGVIDGHIETKGRILVITVIVAGMVSIVLATTIARLKRLLKYGSPKYARRVLLTIVMTTALCVIWAIWSIPQVERAIQAREYRGDVRHAKVLVLKARDIRAGLLFLVREERSLRREVLELSLRRPVTYVQRRLLARHRIALKFKQLDIESARASIAHLEDEARDLILGVSLLAWSPAFASG